MRERPEELLLEVRGEQLSALRSWIIDPVVVHGPHAERDELDSGGPPAELIDQRSPIGSVDELVEHGVGLVGSEEQVRGLDRIQRSRESESGGSERRDGSACQHDAPADGHRRDDAIEHTCGVGVGDEVHVVEHEDQRRPGAEVFLELGERRFCRRGPDIAGDAQESVVGRHGVQRGEDPSEQPDGIVVAAVERQPCGRVSQTLDPAAQQGRLAVAGARRDEQDGALRPVESFEETITPERCIIRARRSEPMRGDSELSSRGGFCWAHLVLVGLPDRTAARVAGPSR